MPVAVGDIVYEIGDPPCSGVGLQWRDGNLASALAGPVKDSFSNDEDIADLKDALLGIGDTGFGVENLANILNQPIIIRDWEVGEVIASVYLTDHRACYFPWPHRYDERRQNVNLPGADLIGFHTDENGDCFSFGEGKTSSENANPPGVVSSLRGQIESLRDEEDLRKTLIIYLGRRSKNSDWRERFASALARYLNNRSDIRIYGFLVRDVKPSQKDIESCRKNIAASIPAGTKIEILALYMPIDTITTFADTVREHIAGGAS